MRNESGSQQYRLVVTSRVGCWREMRLAIGNDRLLVASRQSCAYKQRLEIELESHVYVSKPSVSREDGTCISAVSHTTNFEASLHCTSSS